MKIILPYMFGLLASVESHPTQIESVQHQFNKSSENAIAALERESSDQVKDAPNAKLMDKNEQANLLDNVRRRTMVAARYPASRDLVTIASPKQAHQMNEQNNQEHGGDCTTSAKMKNIRRKEKSDSLTALIERFDKDRQVAIPTLRGCKNERSIQGMNENQERSNFKDSKQLQVRAQQDTELSVSTSMLQK